jgi:2-polyprenyl-6-methoxyphenol hydroxylase-like FAD-dependent oxidoreductase
MSPLGAIGVSVAVGTAIVAADIIHSAIQQNNFSDEFLAQIQNIRMADVKRIQNFQIQAERGIQTGSVWRRKLTALLLPIAVKLGLLQKVMRTIVTLQEPLKLKNKIKINEVA